MTPNTVLVIENESATVTIVERSLQNEGYTMYSAVDSDTGLQRAKELTPSLILLNLAVEGANGLEICKTIHNEDSLKDVPLVLLTLREGKFDPIYTKLYGIVNFLRKPFTPEQLMENVREFAPFQAGAGTPPPQPATAQVEEPEESPSVLEQSFEEETAYGDIVESVEETPAFGDIDEAVEEAPAYGDITESMEEAPSYDDIDTAMGEAPADEMDDDIYTLDEDVSLEDAQAELSAEESVQEDFSVEDFQQEVQTVPESDELPASEDDDFQMPEDDAFPADSAEEEDIASMAATDVFDNATDEMLESAFDVEEHEAPLATTEAEDEIPDGPGLTLDGMGFDEPSEPVEPIEFEMPVEDEEPPPKKRARAAASVKKDRGAMAMKAAGQRRRPTSSVNRPRGRRTLVLLLVLLFVLALAGGGSYYYFFIYEAGAPGPVAQAPTPMPADPTATPQPTAPVPPPAAPPATTAPVPAPKPAPVPPPAKATPPKTPKPAPKPPKVTTLKPPPPRPPAPTRTAQPGSSVPAGSKYTVQFGIFSTEKSAQSLINRLKSKGIKSYIRPRKSSSGKFLYYVLLDDGFKTRDAALAKAHQIETTKGFDTTVHTL